MRNRIMLVLVLMVFMAMVCAIPAIADDRIHNTAGVKADLPKLIGLPQISDDLFIGIEGSREMASDLFYQSYNFFDEDVAYVVWLKITYDACLFNCPDK